VRRGNGHPIRADGLAVGEKEHDVDVRLPLAGIENARRLVRDESSFRKRTLRRDKSFGNSPAPASDGLHVDVTGAPAVLFWGIAQSRRAQENHRSAV
jgi:hypothetical protein